MFINAALTAILCSYVYAAIIFSFFLFYTDSSKGSQILQFFNIHQNNQDTLTKLCFFLIIVTFLGTPITLGFLLKIGVLSSIMSSGAVVVVSAITINLILIVFYLQALRHNQILKKKYKKFLFWKNNVKLALTYNCTFLFFCAAFSAVFFDIIVSII